LKLDTTNLADTSTAGGCNEKNAKLGHRGHKWSLDLLLEFRDPIYISRTVEAANFKFGSTLTATGSNKKLQN